MFLFLFSIFFLNTINFHMQKLQAIQFFAPREITRYIFFSYQIFIIFNRPKNIYQHFIHSYLYSTITNLFKWYNFVLNNFFRVTINEIDMFKMYPHLNRSILHPRIYIQRIIRFSFMWRDLVSADIHFAHFNSFCLRTVVRFNQKVKMEKKKRMSRDS